MSSEETARMRPAEVGSLPGRDTGPGGRLLYCGALRCLTPIQMSELGVSPTRESRHPQAQSFVARTSDYRAITVHLSWSQKFWHRLTEVIGWPGLKHDPRFATYHDRVESYPRLREQVQPPFRTEPFDHWEQALEAADVPFAPVLAQRSMAEHPQTAELDVLTVTPTASRLSVRPGASMGCAPPVSTRPHTSERTPSRSRGSCSQSDVTLLLTAACCFRSLLSIEPIRNPRSDDHGSLRLHPV
jgi:crotonobetainyl-CoA:carnitine CoA-transferase CaiB-like acyl-CoA transferase